MAVQQTGVPLRRARMRPVVAHGLRASELGLLAGAVVIVCLLSILYLAQTGRVATAGHRLQQLEDEHVTLVHAGEQWELRIAKASRLSVVAERAERLGLRTATVDQLRYATVEMPAVPMVASTPDQ